MPRTQARERQVRSPATKPLPHCGYRSRFTPAEEQALVEQRLITAAELESLRQQVQQTGVSPIQSLIRRGIFTSEQIDVCLKNKTRQMRP